MSRIWIFNHYAHTPENGNITRHYDFAGLLQEKGHTVTIFTSSAVHNTDINECKNGEPYVEKNIEGRNYVFVKTRSYGSNGSKRALNMLDFYFGLLKVTKHFEKPDIVYASSPHIFTLQAGIKVAKHLKVPCLCEVRDLWPEAIVTFSRLTEKNPVIRYLYRLEKSIYKKTDGLIFTQPKATNYILEKSWADEIDFSKIYNVNNGVDLRLFQERIQSHPVQDEDLNNRQLFKVVYTGAIRPVNNLGMILDAAKLISNPNVCFLLWGDGNEVPDLKKRILDEKISNVIIKGYVPKPYIPSILSKSNVNLWHYIPLEKSPLRYGISQNKTCEYFASGKPVLATFSVGSEMVLEYNTGMILNESTPQNVARAVEEMASLDEKVLAQMGSNNLRLAQEYDINELAQKLNTAIQNTIERYNREKRSSKC